MPREGYPPEVISGFSWGGRQERGTPPQPPAHQPTGLASGPGRELLELFAQTGLFGGAIDKEQGEGSCLTGSPPNPTPFAMGFPELPIPKSSAKHVGQPPARYSKANMSNHRGVWSPAARGHHWDAPDLR